MALLCRGVRDVDGRGGCACSYREGDEDDDDDENLREVFDDVVHDWGLVAPPKGGRVTYFLAGTLTRSGGLLRFLELGVLLRGQVQLLHSPHPKLGAGDAGGFGEQLLPVDLVGVVEGNPVLGESLARCWAEVLPELVVQRLLGVRLPARRRGRSSCRILRSVHLVADEDAHDGPAVHRTRRSRPASGPRRTTGRLRRRTGRRPRRCRRLRSSRSFRLLSPTVTRISTFLASVEDESGGEDHIADGLDGVGGVDHAEVRG